MTYNSETIAFRVFLFNMLFRYFIFSYKMVHSLELCCISKASNSYFSDLLHNLKIRLCQFSLKVSHIVTFFEHIIYYAGVSYGIMKLHRPLTHSIAEQ